MTIPKITAVEVYESEVLGICAGFQVSFDGSDIQRHLYAIDTTIVCRTDKMLLGTDQYIKDVQIGEATDQGKALALKFIRNDGEELTCGPTTVTYTNTMPDPGKTGN